MSTPWKFFTKIHTNDCFHHVFPFTRFWLILGDWSPCGKKKSWENRTQWKRIETRNKVWFKKTCVSQICWRILMYGKSAVEHRIRTLWFWLSRNQKGARFTRETFMDLQVCSLSCMVSIKSDHIIATSAEVAPNGGLVRESPFKSPWFRFRNYSTLPR